MIQFSTILAKLRIYRHHYNLATDLDMNTYIELDEEMILWHEV